MKFHNLRHTYASFLIDQGENIKYIQKQLGHSKQSVTLDVYAHLFNDENPESANRYKGRKKTVTKKSRLKTVTP